MLDWTDEHCLFPAFAVSPDAALHRNGDHGRDYSRRVTITGTAKKKSIRSLYSLLGRIRLSLRIVQKLAEARGCDEVTQQQGALRRVQTVCFGAAFDGQCATGRRVLLKPCVMSSRFR